jgi:hypothetical protein
MPYRAEGNHKGLPLQTVIFTSLLRIVGAYPIGFARHDMALTDKGEYPFIPLY